MVNSCVAYKCNNLHHPSKKIPFHTFPFKRPDILKLWVKAIQRDKWYPSKTSRLCGLHFIDKDYQIRPGSEIKLLQPNAVPSIFSFSKPLEQDNLTTRRVLKTVKTDIDLTESMNVDVDFNDTAPIASPSNTVDAATQTNVSYNSTQVYSYRRKIKILKQKVRRRNLKISNMKELIHKISRNGCSNENFESFRKLL